MELTQEYLKNILDYNPEIGLLSWKVSRGNVKKGSVVSYVEDGYIRIGIDGIVYQAHRIIWLWMIGEWPELHLDHINGDRSDNRLCNLREATYSQNAQNRKLANNNTSGYKGVSFKSNKWVAGINLGAFNTKEEAALAYNEAATKLFGEYAKLNEVHND